MRAMAAAPVPVHRLASPRLNADERRADVLEAAIKAFAVGGYAGTSTEEIARLAGVSQPYLFRLFGSKQALFMAAVGRCFEKVRAEFTDAARHPLPATDLHPVLSAIAARYAGMLKDLTLLRLQLHAYAASSDPVIRDFVRAEFARLIAAVSALSGEPVADLRDFFAQGMLMNLAAALELTEADVAWQLMCEGGTTPD
jgi:AcrR family transcriptional regulator